VPPLPGPLVPGTPRTSMPTAVPCPSPTRRAGGVPELVEQVDVDAPPEQVWAALVDWDRQGEGMLLTDVRSVDGDGQGVGGRLAAVTGVKLPGRRRIGVLDTMLITAWEFPRRVDVRHTGRVVRGTGTFQVRPRDGGGSTFVWTEGLELPLGALG